MQSRTTNLILFVVCASLLGELLWQGRSHRIEMDRLTGQVTALSQQLVAAQTAKRGVVVEPMQPKLVNPPPQTIKEALPPVEDNRRFEASVAKLSEDLAAARSRISELESKALSLEADRATLAQQRQQDLVANEETCRARTADVQHSLEATQTDLKSAQQRAALFESENANLRKAQAAKSAAHSAESDLEELARRRDTYLKSVMRRFREIDTEYRGLLRDPQGIRPNDAATFRLQSLLAQAEDDLRQLDAFSAKTQLVEKKREKN